MTIPETLAYLRSLTDPTPEQLREASDLALLARGWKCKIKEGLPEWYDQDGLLWFGLPPNVAADLTDAVRWMVPEGYLWEVLIALDYVEVRYVKLGDHPDKQGKERAKTEPLARTIASLAAIGQEE